MIRPAPRAFTRIAAFALVALPTAAPAAPVETLTCAGEYGGVPLEGVMTQTYLDGFELWAWAGAFTNAAGENYIFEGTGDRRSAFGAATEAGEYRRAIRIRLDAEPGGFVVLDERTDRTGRFTCG